MVTCVGTGSAKSYTGKYGHPVTVDAAAIEGDAFFRGVIQAWEQVRDGSLTRATGADQRCQLARPDFEAHFPQRPTWLPHLVLGGAVVMLLPLPIPEP